MNKDITQSVNEALDAFGAKKIKALFKLGITVIDLVAMKKQDHNDRMNILLSPQSDADFCYNQVLIKNYISRRFKFYDSPKIIKLSQIKKEIEKQRIARNIIITGHACIGKTTTLKWLFVNVSVSKDEYSHIIFCSAKIFRSCKSRVEFVSIFKKILVGIDV